MQHGAHAWHVHRGVAGLKASKQECFFREGFGHVSDKDRCGAYGRMLILLVNSTRHHKNTIHVFFANSVPKKEHTAKFLKANSAQRRRTNMQNREPMGLVVSCPIVPQCVVSEAGFQGGHRGNRGRLKGKDGEAKNQ